MNRRQADRDALWDATPWGETDALSAAEIADRVPGRTVSRRSAGTKLNAMFLNGYVPLGLRAGIRVSPRVGNRVTLYWREAPDSARTQP